ncbi:hypothetical protein WH96_04135 [Kiloniella spongiae]|uniref:Uncharacterized protein n=1 Tax=Kiloniella spongiae TaxID=1489064 RepID=A0A0H2MGQ6_9PROT|nr:hypothetical protein [Kiloniella spongiae]KLN61563.1 hypothetical protein WH96_04135 [Kiloniella spongiae]
MDTESIFEGSLVLLFVLITSSASITVSFEKESGGDLKLDRDRFKSGETGMICMPYYSLYRQKITEHVD